MSSKLSRRNEPTFIASSSSRPYLAADMFRFLASLLVAFGLMFAPVAMAHGQIMAAPHNSASAMVKIDDGVGKHSPSSSHRSEMDLSCAITCAAAVPAARSEEHTSELQSLMRISYAVFCLKKKKKKHRTADIESP